MVSNVLGYARFKTLLHGAGSMRFDVDGEPTWSGKNEDVLIIHFRS